MALGKALLVERDRELRVLDTVWGGLAACEGQALLIEGPAGIGKSRLLGELRRLASDAGVRVLASRPGELERDFPFGVVRQLFEGVLADPAERERALAAAAAPSRGVFTALADDEAGGGEGDFATLHGLYWLALNLAAEEPLVLCVDDLQWCDRPSLRFLAYLVRRVEGQPILVATTLRTGEETADLALVADIAQDPVTTVVRPGALSLPAVRELLADRLGGEPDDAFAGACLGATGGNPLLLLQLLTALEADGVTPQASAVAAVADIGPRAVARTVLVRLGRLPEAAVAAARAVAVLGESASVEAVAAMAGVDERAAAEAIAALIRADLLAAEPPLDFVHPLVREAVYRELAPGLRGLEHLRAAEVLRAAGARVDGVAAQLLHAPRRGEAWVVDTLVDAGRSALAKGAPENAAAYLRRALAEPPPAARRAEVQLELGLAEAHSNGPAVIEHLTAAYGELTDPGARLAAGNVLARVLMFTRSGEEGRLFAARVADDLPTGWDDERKALQALQLATTYFGGGTLDLRRELDPWRDRARSLVGIGDKLLGGLASFDWSDEPGPAGAVCELALAALAGGDAIAFDTAFLAVPPLRTLALADHPEGLAAWEPALQHAHRQGSEFEMGTIHLWRSYALLVRGDLTEAVEGLHAATRSLVEWGHDARNPCPTALLAEALREAGDLPGAWRALGQMPDLGDRLDAYHLWRTSRAALLLAAGRLEEAADDAAEIGRRFDWSRNPTTSRWRGIRAEALGRLGRRDEAVELAEAELELARRWGAPGGLGRSLRILGELRGGTDGLRLLEEATAVLDGSVARLETTKAFAAHGRMLRQERRPGESREPLRRALELADACGAAALVEHVRTELYAAGARPRTTALGGVESLTASERRVVLLAAEGGTNREIAQALFVTPKTVEVHLSNAYRKLGVRSRHELAAAVGAMEATA